jgi:NAD(P)-dependent dehydrogenase (short-subunit alcohol dehydrogenase family)
VTGQRLAGKVALVTGAARERGIGRGIGLCLAEDGCDVVVNDVAAVDEGEELVGRIRALGRRAIFHRADVSDRSQVDEMVDATMRELGRLDVVCSNAGVADWQTLVDVTPESFRRQVGVNLTGAFNVCQAGARALVAQGGGGRIVVTSSVHVQMPFPAMSVYGATKSALRAMTEHMAIELAPHGITANHIGPGWVRSFINDRSPALQTDDDVEATLELIPAGRPAEPEDLGHAVCYLASDEASYVSGAFLRVDGGFVVGKY